MAGAVAETGAAEKAAETLTFHAKRDHVIATMPSRDAPMRASVCRKGNLRSTVQPI